MHSSFLQKIKKRESNDVEIFMNQTGLQNEFRRDSYGCKTQTCILMKNTEFLVPKNFFNNSSRIQAIESKNEISRDKLNKILKKYDKIANIAKSRENFRKNQAEKQRQNYLMNTHKLAEMRQKMEELEDMKKKNILTKINAKTRQASVLRQSVVFEKQAKSISQKFVFREEVKKRLQKIKGRQVITLYFIFIGKFKDIISTETEE